jgi:hypothetical protein
MRNHTLMQTIARANRMLPGKYSRLIVDYANVFASLEQVLAIYRRQGGGRRRGRDRTLGHLLAHQQIPQSDPRCCGAADPESQRLQDQQPDLPDPGWTLARGKPRATALFT